MLTNTTDQERHVGNSFCVKHWQGIAWLREDITIDHTLDAVWPLNSPQTRRLLLDHRAQDRIRVPAVCLDPVTPTAHAALTRPCNAFTVMMERRRRVDRDLALRSLPVGTRHSGNGSVQPSIRQWVAI